MPFYMKELPKEDILRKLSNKYGHLDKSKIELVVRLYKFSSDLEKAKETHFKQYGLSDGRFMVLMAIWEAHAPIKATDIADKLGVSRATMTGLIDSLIKDNFVEKKDCPEDRRAAYLSLSDHGHTFLKKMLPEHFLCVKNFADTITDEEAQTFLKILAKLSSGLRQFEEHCEDSMSKNNP